MKVNLLSRVQFLATPWTAAHQAPPSVEFSRQESWSGVQLPSLDPTPRHSDSIDLGLLKKLKRASLVVQLVNNLSAIQETLLRFLGQEDTLEKG